MNEASTLIHALNDMWNSQNIDRLASFYAPDVEHEDVTSGVTSLQKIGRPCAPCRIRRRCRTMRSTRPAQSSSGT